MSLPTKIFKYQPPTVRAISNLSAGSIYFSSPLEFNDPFDCALTFDMPEIKKLIDGMDDADALEMICNTLPDESKSAACQLSGAALRRVAYQGVENAIETHVNRDRGVSCFSETNLSLLMWGHYADRHRGYCLEFTTDIDPFNDPAKLRKVSYRDSVPSFDINRLKQGDTGHLLDLLFTKADCWSYEVEWRLLHRESRKLFGCLRDCLTGIYFGAKIDAQHKDMICGLLSRTRTKFYDMTIVLNRFELNSLEFSFTPFDYTGEEPVLVR